MSAKRNACLRELCVATCTQISADGNLGKDSKGGIYITDSTDARTSVRLQGKYASKSLKEVATVSVYRADI